MTPPLPLDAKWREGCEADDCDWCCVNPAVEECGGDRLCASCADEWHESIEMERERDELEGSMRGAGLYRGLELEARLAMLDAGLRRFDRLERRHSARAGRDA